MGMSTHVVGIKPPDEKWRQMKAIYDTCVAGKVDPPEAVSRFFNDERPDPKGVLVDVQKKGFGAVTEWSDDMAEGFEVDLKKLPPDITVLRFYKSW